MNVNVKILFIKKILTMSMIKPESRNSDFLDLGVVQIEP